MTGCLKGTDAALFAAFEALGLQPKLRFVADTSCEVDDEEAPKKVLLDHTADLGSTEVDEVVSRLIEDERGIAIDDVDADSPDAAEMGKSKSDYYGYETLRVHWVTKMKALNTVRSGFVAYGNQAELSHLYLEACLVVIVGPVEDRKAVSTKLKV